MFVFDGTGVTGRRGLPGIAISLVVVVGAIGAWWLLPAAKTTSTSSTSAGSYSCAVAVIGSDPAQEKRALEVCQRQAADAARRAPQPSQAPVDPDATRISNAMFTAVCHTDTGWTCDAPRPASQADVTAVQEVLTGLGYLDAVVRLQRPGDPAPDGSVVYAVRLGGDRCVVAFVTMGSGPNNNGTSGLLPNGECLAA